jgi:hypothetical protein
MALHSKRAYLPNRGNRPSRADKGETMSSAKKPLIFLGIAFFLCGHLSAQVMTVQEQIQCKASELNQHPIKAGDLSLTISGFKNGTFKLLVQNSSETFCQFYPDDFLATGEDGNQYFIEFSYINLAGRTLPPTPVKIAPKAHLSFIYGLNGEVKLPAKIYYAGKFAIEITR